MPNSRNSLKTLSTEELFNLVLEYPLLNNIYVFNDVDEGIKRLFDNFNGIRELALRKNVSNLFTDSYVKSMNKISPLLKNRLIRLEEKGRAIATITILETLSTSNYFMKNTSEEEKTKILHAISNGYKIKASIPEEFQGLSMETTEKAIDHINKVLGRESAITTRSAFATDIPITVKTPFGSNVPAWKMAESSASQRAFYDEDLSRQFPNAIKLQTYDGYSSTRRFNCHGYAWHRVEHQNSPNEDCWIGYDASENDPEKIYTTDGSYNRLNYNVAGAKIVWASGNHTAVNVDNTWCISKWNEYPLMKHRIGDSPFGNSNLQYYYYNYNLTINGPDYVGAGEVATYTLNNPPRNGTLVWSVPSNLEIVSGQNTTQLRVKPPANGGGGQAKITVTINTLVGERTVLVNTPMVTRITGPATGRTGQTLYFNAEPIYPSSMGQYIWSVSPYSMVTTWQYQSYFTPSSSGTYLISCYFRTTAGSQGPPAQFYCSVSSSYYVFSSDKNITIQPQIQEGLAITETKSALALMEYTLVNPTTGVLIDKGKIDKTGGTLNYSSVPKGIYILTLKINNDNVQTFKIIL